MKLVDILTSPWAIRPEKLLEIQGIYRTHLRGEKIDLGAIEAKLGRPLANDPPPYEVVSGVAVIQMEGIVAKRMSLFQKISGGVSTYHIQQQFSEALADRKVRAILLNIDSPGGSVDGTAELAEMIYAARGEKPIVAWTDGMMASAAYWIGSAADQVFISGETADVGSIGVVASHVDFSKFEVNLGIKTTEITAGKYKRIASEYAPLSKEGKAYIQEQVDHIYSVFVDAVARHRGVSSEEVVQRMADGRIFLGRRALDAGMVDGVSTMEGLIGKLSAGEFTAARLPAAGAVAAAIDETEEDYMKVKAGEDVIDVQDTLEIDAKWISENCPDIAGALRGEGAAAERERIQGVEEAALPGYEKIVSEAKADGKSTGADVALKIVKAENLVRADKLVEIESGSVKPVPGVAVDGVPMPKDQGKKGFMSLVDQYQAETKCSRGVAIQETVKAHPEAHKAWLVEQEAKS